MDTLAPAVSEWIETNGSELLKARIENKFEYVDLLSTEFRNYIASQLIGIPWESWPINQIKPRNFWQHLYFRLFHIPSQPYKVNPEQFARKKIEEIDKSVAKDFPFECEYESCSKYEEEKEPSLELIGKFKILIRKLKLITNEMDGYEFYYDVKIMKVPGELFDSYKRCFFITIDSVFGNSSIILS